VNDVPEPDAAVTPPDSLAAQAAAWVPPWARPTPDAAAPTTADLDPAQRDAAEVDGAEPNDAEFDGAEQGAELDGVEPNRAEVDGAEPSGAEVDGAEPSGAEVDGARLDGAGLDGAGLDGAGPNRAELSGVVPDAAEATAADRDAAEPDADEPDGAVASGAAESGAADLDEPAAHSQPAAPDPADRDEALPVDAAEPPASPAASAALSVDGAASAPVLPMADLRPALEAILLVVDEPVGEQLLAQVLEQPVDVVGAELVALADAYTEQGRGFELRRAAGGWRLYTRPEYAAYVERFVLDGQSVRLTQAALETLAVVAYKQPVTRSRISAIRGVNCDGVIRTLVTRGLIEETGTEPESGAYLYRTSSLFLEKLGLDSVAQLPPLAPFLPDNVDEIAGDVHR
jgi:segregation and condensation protein B